MASPYYTSAQPRQMGPPFLPPSLLFLKAFLHSSKKGEGMLRKERGRGREGNADEGAFFSLPSPFAKAAAVFFLSFSSSSSSWVGR